MTCHIMQLMINIKYCIFFKSNRKRFRSIPIMQYNMPLKRLVYLIRWWTWQINVYVHFYVVWTWVGRVGLHLSAFRSSVSSLQDKLCRLESQMPMTDASRYRRTYAYMCLKSVVWIIARKLLCSCTKTMWKHNVAIHSDSRRSRSEGLRFGRWAGQPYVRQRQWPWPQQRLGHRRPRQLRLPVDRSQDEGFVGWV